MIIKTQKVISFRNECNCIVDVKLLESAILWWQSRPTSANKKIYLHGIYPAVSIHNEKLHVHRLIKSFDLGSKLVSGVHVHHKNHNKLDASLSNLEIIDASTHLSKHNRGRKLSKAHKEKIRLAGKARKGIVMKKRINIPETKLASMLESGLSINSIAKHFKCDWSTIKTRIHQNPELLEKAA